MWLHLHRCRDRSRDRSVEDCEGGREKIIWCLLEGFLEEVAAASHPLLKTTVIAGSSNFLYGPEGSL